VGAVPPQTRVELTCDGPGCFSEKRERFIPDGAEVVFLTSSVPRLLRPGSSLEVRITKPDTIGKSVEYRIRPGRLPTRSVRCLPPGAAPVPR
jgi:hypothetical protein